MALTPEQIAAQIAAQDAATRPPVAPHDAPWVAPPVPPMPGSPLTPPMPGSLPPITIPPVAVAKKSHSGTIIVLVIAAVLGVLGFLKVSQHSECDASVNDNLPASCNSVTHEK